MVTQAGMNEGDTFPRILVENARRFGESRAAFREKDLGIWQSYSWGETLKQVEAQAVGLASLGFKRGDKMVVVGDNRPPLYWGMLAAQSLGGVPVPLYQDSIEREMQFVVEHAEARFALVEDQEQADKLLNIKETCRNLEYIIYSDPRGLRNYAQPFLLSIAEVQAKGAEFAEKNPGYFSGEVAKGSPEDLAIICYTSGTTGKPKGVMLSHGGFIESSRKLAELEQLREGDSVMAYLPMAWVGDFFVSIGLALVRGLTVNCPENSATVIQDIREIGPPFFFAPPRIWENILTDIMTRIEDAGWIQRKLFRFFTDFGVRMSQKELAGQPLGLGEKLLYAIGRVLVLSPLRDNFGFGRVRFAYTAGEAMGPEILAFFRSLGINLKQIYALTEAGIFVSVPRTGEVRSETCGPPVPWVEVKISDSGEVLFKSPSEFVGYYKDEAGTRATKVDGWVHTGDAGFIDHQGHLKIVDRANDVSELSDGTMFSPKYLENKLKFSPFIREAVTIGMGRPFVTAMLCIDPVSVGNWAERNNISYTGYTDIAQKPEVYQLILEEIRRVNSTLADDDQLRGAQIKKFLIFHKDLDPDDEEITRTRKIRRGFITEKYKTMIDALYTDADHVQVKAELTFEDGRKATVDADVKISPVAESA